MLLRLFAFLRSNRAIVSNFALSLAVIASLSLQTTYAQGDGTSSGSSSRGSSTFLGEGHHRNSSRPQDSSGKENNDILGWIFIAVILLISLKMAAEPKQTAQAAETPANENLGSDATVNVSSSAQSALRVPTRTLNAKESIDASQARTVEDAAKILERVTDPDPIKQDEFKARHAIEIIKLRVRSVGWDGVPATETFANLFGFGDAGIRNIERAGNRKQVEAGQDVDIAEATWILKIAQCGEHAELLGKLLNQAGVKDVEVILAQNPTDATSNHCFVAIGRQPGSNPHDPRKWGNRVIVADSYQADNGKGEVTGDMNKVWDIGAYYAHGNRTTFMIHRPGQPRQWIKK